jgi:long-subunit acyl-CoA synthetase (AMP-forming)
MKNTYYYYATVFAVLKSGCNVLLVDYRVTPESLSEYMSNVKVSYIISDVLKVESIQGVEVVSLATLLENTSVSEIPNVWADRLAFSTSGTVGKSKIAVYTGEKIYTQITRCADYYLADPCFASMLKHAPNEPLRTLFALPMNHIFGFIKPLVLSCYGFSIVMPDNLTLTTVLRACATGHVTLMAGVPMLWSAIRNIILSRYGEITSTSVASLLGEYIAIMMSGGANTNVQLRQSFVDAGIYFVVGYGLTETGIISYMLPQRSDITSEGVCFDWYKCAVKTDDNEILEEGQGELLIKSDVLMDGFYMGGTFHEIELTDGYYNTEDIFKIHNGEIFFMGRSKNVIVNDSGENIYIEELEQYFSETFSSVGMFFGIIDRNDQPYLVVESSQGDIPKELFSLVHAKVKELPIYKQPKEMVVTSTALPRTTKGELKRNLVTEDFLEKNSNKTYNFKATIQ